MKELQEAINKVLEHAMPYGADEGEQEAFEYICKIAKRYARIEPHLQNMLAAMEQELPHITYKHGDSFADYLKSEACLMSLGYTAADELTAIADILKAGAENSGAISGWRDIETMPDNTRVLVYSKWEGEIAGKTDDYDIYIASDNYIEGGDYYAAWHVDATHWMPLPQPPTEETK